MIRTAERIRIHVLDPIPGAVTVKLSETLRGRGHAVDVRGDGPDLPRQGDLDPERFLSALPGWTGGTRIYVTARPLGTAPSAVETRESAARGAVLVSLPATPRGRPIDRSLADDVLGAVDRALVALTR